MKKLIVKKNDSKQKEFLINIQHEVIGLYYDIFPINWAMCGNCVNMLKEIRRFIKTNSITYEKIGMPNLEMKPKYVKENKSGILPNVNKINFGFEDEIRNMK